MSKREIIFPIIELTESLFDEENIFVVDETWSKVHYIKEKDFEKQHQRILLDSRGQILKVSEGKIIGKKGVILSFIIPPTLIVEFNLELTGRTMDIEEVKRNVISKSSRNFNIYHNKVMTEPEFNSKVRGAGTFEALFKIAGFLDEK